MPVTKNHKERQKEKHIRADESANAHIKIPYNIKTHKNTVKMTPRGEKQLKNKMVHYARKTYKNIFADRKQTHLAQYCIYSMITVPDHASISD